MAKPKSDAKAPTTAPPATGEVEINGGPAKMSKSAGGDRRPRSPFGAPPIATRTSEQIDQAQAEMNARDQLKENFTTLFELAIKIGNTEPNPESKEAKEFNTLSSETKGHLASLGEDYTTAQIEDMAINAFGNYAAKKLEHEIHNGLNGAGLIDLADNHIPEFASEITGIQSEKFLNKIPKAYHALFEIGADTSKRLPRAEYEFFMKEVNDEYTAGLVSKEKRKEIINRLEEERAGLREPEQRIDLSPANEKDRKKIISAHKKAVKNLKDDRIDNKARGITPPAGMGAVAGLAAAGTAATAAAAAKDPSWVSRTASKFVKQVGENLSMDSENGFSYGPWLRISVASTAGYTALNGLNQLFHGLTMSTSDLVKPQGMEDDKFRQMANRQKKKMIFQGAMTTALGITATAGALYVRPGDWNIGGKNGGNGGTMTR